MKDIWNRILVISAAIAIVVGLGACNKSSTGGNGGNSSADAIKIGVILPLSGGLAPYGKNCLAGIELRVEQINAAGGINGKKIQLIKEDNQGKKPETVQAYKKLTGIDKVVAVIGPITSTNSLSIVREATRTKTPTVTPMATNDKVAPASPYMFRAIFNDTFQGKVLADYTLNEMKFTKAAAIRDQGSDYSKGLIANFTKFFEAGGGKVVTVESYQTGETEFGAQLSRIKQSGAQVVFVPSYPPALQKIIKDAAVIGLEAVFCGSDGWDDPTVINGSGDKIVGAYFTSAVAEDVTRPIVQDFFKAIKAKTGRESAGSFEAEGYDSVSIVAEGLKAGTTKEEVHAALTKIKGLELVTGTISFDKDGESLRSAFIMSVKKDGDKFAKHLLKTANP